MRLEMESKYWRDMCFVTLTYNDDNLPINVIDGQLFFNEDEGKKPRSIVISIILLTVLLICNFIKRKIGT